MEAKVEITLNNFFWLKMTTNGGVLFRKIRISWRKNVQKIVNAFFAISGSFLGHQQKNDEKMTLSEKAAFESL